MNDYKTQFNEEVTALISANITDRAERMAAVQALIDRYLTENGVTPDITQLERLANYILHEELTDPDPYKSEHNEYPILSEWQMELRRSREIPLDMIIDHVGTDGVDYRLPTRRIRSRREKAFLDRTVRSKNLAIRREHENFKSGKSVGVFSVNIATGEKTLRNKRKYEEFYEWTV